MGSNSNFKNTGTRPPGEMIAGASDFTLTRQQHPSIYSLTFEEFQTTVGGAGKDLGSMNMDELLKNIWSADENHTTGGDRELQRQGSLTLPRTLSSKTVDEVWQTMSSKEAADHRGRGFCFYPPTLGEVTLEEFLVRAGVVRETAAGDHQPPDAAGLFSDYPCIVASSGSGYGFGFGESGLTQSPQPRILPKQPNPDPATSTDMAGINTVITRSLAAVVSSDTYTFNGGLRGRKSTAALEKVVERRHRRMIKNRESAARSRERKQAYTMELEAEVAKLKEENASLQKRQEKLLEIQKKQAVEMANQRNRSKRRCLRRTQTCPIVASIRAHGGRHILF